MTVYPLAPNGIFWTLQGEGALQGEPMVFVRLAGCSIGCPQCDTDYRVAERLTAEDIVRRIQDVVPAGFLRPWVWITGGEPTDHDLEQLISVLQTLKFPVAIATAGTRPTPLVDWISVSPHSANAVQRFGHELKVVPGLNGLSWADLKEIDNWRSFPYRYLQPLAGSQESLDRCIAFVQSTPGWRLTNQSHKSWSLP